MNKSGESNESRYVGGNWDEATVRVRRNGGKQTLKRKVVTKGVKTLNLGAAMKAAKEWLRQGYEVRIADEHGEEAIRIYHLVSTDCRSMYPQAATMGRFRRDALAGKTVRVRHCGVAVTKEHRQELVEEQAKRHEKSAEGGLACVTPDTVVQCPNCGTQFRVGKVLAGKKRI